MKKIFDKLTDLLDCAFKHIEKHGNHFISIDYGDVRNQLLADYDLDEDEPAIILCEKTNVCLLMDAYWVGPMDWVGPMNQSDLLVNLIDTIYEDEYYVSDHMMLTCYLENEQLRKLFKLKAFI